MPFERASVVHKIGIISEAHRAQLHDRLQQHAAASAVETGLHTNRQTLQFAFETINNKYSLLKWDTL